MIRGKKGGMLDLFLAIAVSFIVVMFFVLMTYASKTTYNKLQEVAPSIQSQFEENVSVIIAETVGKTDTSYLTLRWMSVFLIFGFFLSILVSSFLVKTNPVFFAVYIFIVIIAVIFSVPVSNTYERVYQDPLLASSFTGFFGATWIFLHLPLWVTIIGLLAGILMFTNIDWGNFY